MPGMTDPSIALPIYQQQIEARAIPLQKCVHSPDLYVAVDHPGGRPRFSYMRLRGNTLLALAMFAQVEPVDGVPCFQMGIAVPVAYRRQGLGYSTLAASIREMKEGFARTILKDFFLEAIVDVTNDASNRIITRLFGVVPKSITDEFSGASALQYVVRASAVKI